MSPPDVDPEPLRDAAVLAVQRAMPVASQEAAEDVVDAITQHVVEVVTKMLEAKGR